MSTSRSQAFVWCHYYYLYSTLQMIAGRLPYFFALDLEEISSLGTDRFHWKHSSFDFLCQQRWEEHKNFSVKKRGRLEFDEESE